MTQLFNLKSVLRLTGLNPDTIRAWEKRYVAVKPQRTATGRRMYTQQEVNRLKLLAELTASGHSISSVANLTDDKLVALLATNHSGTPLIKSKQLDPQIPQVTEQLLEAVERFDLNSLEIHLSRAAYSMSSRDLLFHMIPQLMYKVGNKVIAGELSIAQEHALSEKIKRQIRRIFDQLEPVDGTFHKDKILLFATPEQHLHDFGLWLSAILCRFQGFKTVMIGPNLPAQSLISAAKQMNPHAIIIGFSPVNLNEFKVKPISYLREVHLGIPQNTMFWLGGGYPKFSSGDFNREIWKFDSLEELERKIEDKY